MITAASFPAPFMFAAFLLCFSAALSILPMGVWLNLIIPLTLALGTCERSNDFLSEIDPPTLFVPSLFISMYLSPFVRMYFCPAVLTFHPFLRNRLIDASCSVVCSLSRSSPNFFCISLRTFSPMAISAVVSVVCRAGNAFSTVWLICLFVMPVMSMTFPVGVMYFLARNPLS